MGDTSNQYVLTIDNIEDQVRKFFDISSSCIGTHLSPGFREIRYYFGSSNKLLIKRLP